MRMNRIRSYCLNRDGLALPVAVAVIAVISILALTAGTLWIDQTGLGKRYLDRKRAIAVAEAGMEEYLWHLRDNPNFFDDSEGYEFVFDSSGNPLVHEVKGADGKTRGWYRIEPLDSDPGKGEDGASLAGAAVKHNGVDGRTEIRVACTGWIGTENNPTYKVRVEAKLRRYGLTERDPAEDEGITPRRKLLAKVRQEKRNLIDRQIDKLKEIAKDRNALEDKGNCYYFRGRTSLYFHDNQFDVVTWDWKDGRWYAYKCLSKPISNGTSGSSGGVVIYVARWDGYSPGGYPQDGDAVAKWYYKRGNVFVSGRVPDCNVTIVAEDNIYITGVDPCTEGSLVPGTTTNPHTGFNYKYTQATYPRDTPGIYTPDPRKSVIGLVARGNVRILHSNWPAMSYASYAPGDPAWDGSDPATWDTAVCGQLYDGRGRPLQEPNVWGDGSRGTMPARDVSLPGIYVDAAVLAENGSFGFEGPDWYSLETAAGVPIPGSVRRMDYLFFNGIIVEKDRGSFGSDETGYPYQIPAVPGYFLDYAYSFFYNGKLGNPSEHFNSQNEYGPFYFPGTWWRVVGWKVTMENGR